MANFAKLTETMGTISQKEIYMGKFNDKRLDKRALKLSALLYAGGRAAFMRFCQPKQNKKVLIDY